MKYEVDIDSGYPIIRYILPCFSYVYSFFQILNCCLEYRTKEESRRNQPATSSNRENNYIEITHSLPPIYRIHIKKPSRNSCCKLKISKSIEWDFRRLDHIPLREKKMDRKTPQENPTYKTFAFINVMPIRE